MRKEIYGRMLLEKRIADYASMEETFKRLNKGSQKENPEIIESKKRLEKMLKRDKEEIRILGNKFRGSEMNPSEEDIAFIQQSIREAKKAGLEFVEYSFRLALENGSDPQQREAVNEFEKMMGKVLIKKGKCELRVEMLTEYKTIDPIERRLVFTRM